MVIQEINQFRISANVLTLEPLRYTPAGVPALNLQLGHHSQISEASQTRQVDLVLKAVALGAVAERLIKLEIGSKAWFLGFLATPHGTKRLLFHIQEFTKEQSLSPLN